MTPDRSMREEELQRLVRAMCNERGLAVEHVGDSLAGKTWLPGMPDLQVFGTAILYRELKGMGRGLSPSQLRVSVAIRRAGGNYRVWCPMDLADGTIERELDEIA